MQKILLLEDDVALGNGIRLALQSPQAHIVLCRTLTQARDTIAQGSFDLLILDINLPDGSGLELLEQVRQSGNLPVILLTANDMEMDIVTGLESGADDYITKPFAIEELLARIRAALRNHGGHDSQVLTAGELSMDIERHRVTVRGQEVELTKKEFDLLRHLLENKGRVLTREALLDSVWGFDFVGETNSVDVYIRFLRSKIDEAFGIKLIHTVRGVGYVIKEE